jgi:YVTN family beta-propeller protein
MRGKNCKTVNVFFVIVLIFFVSCKKDKPEAVAITNSTGNVYIVCEGSLGNGNAALSLYDSKAILVNEDIYKSSNAGQALGDIFQSMRLIGDRLFLCINNSDKVVAIDKATHKLIGTINIPKPRYILSITSTKAYVSTLFSNKVYIINPQTLQVTGSIDLPDKNPEGMLLQDTKAYICTWDTATNKIYRVNIITDEIEQEIPVAGNAPQEVLDDVYGRLWVLSGNIAKGKQAALTCLDPLTGKIVKSYTFSSQADPIRPVFNEKKDKLYFIEVNYSGGTTNNGIYSVNINDGALPSTPLISAQQYQYFWALGIEPNTGNIYVGDPKGFIQKGSVYIYDTAGKQTSSFNVGLGPGHFYFDNK